jgi:hypothetical protein
MGTRIPVAVAVVAAFFMLGSVALAVTRWVQTNKPIASCPESTFDFGTANKGDTFVHEFRIQNLGRKTLRVLEVHTGCPCVSLDALQTPWASPGGSVGINMRYTARMIGVERSVVLVKINDPKTPNLVLRLRGVVREPGSPSATMP